MKAYIAGPMTGLPLLNFPAFHSAARGLRERGHEVISPAEVNPDTNMTWAEAMRRDIPHLVACDTIVMLPGWIKSRGARLELSIAIELGMRVLSLADAVGVSCPK